MLGGKDEVSFKILAYKNINDTNEFPIALKNISEIDETFKLPIQTERINVLEYDYNNPLLKVKNISTIYLGIELDLKQILSYGRQIKLDPKLNLSIKDIHRQIKKSRFLVTFDKEGKIIIRKLLTENEIVLDSLFEIEYYLKMLGTELSTMRQQIEEARKLLRFQDEIN